MRRLFDHLSYYWDKFAKGSITFLSKALIAFSFLMLVFYFGYIVYYSVVCYSMYKVIIGCISMFTMIHLNKSL